MRGVKTVFGVKKYRGNATWKNFGSWDVRKCKEWKEHTRKILEDPGLANIVRMQQTRGRRRFLDRERKR